MTTLISYDLNLETDCTLIPTSEKKTISREDNKITVTFERALNYLKQALETYEIASLYKRYFTKIIYDAQIEAFKKSESNSDVIKNFEKNLENRLFQEINDLTPPEDVKFNTFKEIMDLSLQCMTIDKKSGELFLVLNNQHYFQRYFLVKIDISEDPSIADWKIIATDLRTDPYQHPMGWDWWYDEWMYTSATSIYENFSNDLLEEVVFTKEIDLTVGEKPSRHANYNYLDRKYLIIKRKDGSEQYFKSPFEKVPPLILDGDNEHPELLPLTTKKVTPGCYFIEKESLMKFLTLPLLKSARSSTTCTSGES